MIALSNHQLLTPEEYLALEAQSLIKHEYIDGETYVTPQEVGTFKPTLPSR